MTSTRRQRKEMVKWERATRSWGTERARRLVLDLHQGQVPTPLPYTVGLVLWAGERPIVEVPARCSIDRPVPALDPHAPAQPPVSPWLVTDQRIAGRLGTGVIWGRPWSATVGFRADLTPSREWVQFDFDGAEPVVLRGPGVAPLAVVAVWVLHGPRALLDHPGLASLRQVPDDAVERITQAAPALGR